MLVNRWSEQLIEQLFNEQLIEQLIEQLFNVLCLKHLLAINHDLQLTKAEEAGVVVADRWWSGDACEEEEEEEERHDRRPNDRRMTAE